jgi:hypothetical protein
MEIYISGNNRAAIAWPVHGEFTRRVLIMLLVSVVTEFEPPFGRGL